MKVRCLFLCLCVWLNLRAGFRLLLRLPLIYININILLIYKYFIVSSHRFSFLSSSPFFPSSRRFQKSSL
ncbi:hypothetical protein ABB37_02133 [Leptomonas pyrrhocoris]|uniref:Uncharacterized protein n=1 Tax=Leptomonas pyrrhocoris TaxID=157538 RepID=A0A0M9G7J4_LEPPY|nr:hypothetical protein ABB37_02133 [Leptomonas pyrrhocoris]KPA83989.1 hypothetical protein ABB37_02133 [Leptomonas pyrrhocoris]|eukprot:XP_015662428.1 hypothetical protein ABB37_02133 [Leptomonas pyrrhocoris]